MGAALRLTVIGCSGSFPGPDSSASCYLVEAPWNGGVFRLLLDLGSGALGALQRHVDLRDIDAVALSHLHSDHFFDLCAFYVVRKYHPDGAWPPLPVFGPHETAERLRLAYGMEPGTSMDAEFAFSTYPGEPFRMGPFTVTVARVDHPGTAYALRVSLGASSLVYSGDTAPCSALETLANNCDLLLAEASFLERGADTNAAHVHLTGRQAAHTASHAGVKRLVLTHVPPWYRPEEVHAEAAPHFAGELHMAEPGAVFEL